jgi:hypothetical protein
MRDEPFADLPVREHDEGRAALLLLADRNAHDAIQLQEALLGTSAYGFDVATLGRQIARNDSAWVCVM